MRHPGDQPGWRPVIVADRFRGPPGSANGGYLSGLLAARVGTDGPVTVTLRRPPPLDRDLAVSPDDDGVRLHLDDQLIGEARAADAAPAALDPVTPGAAEQAMSRYAGLVEHPFPGCFVCGVDRAADDGLALRPGPLADDPATVACLWRPHVSLAGEDGRTLPAEQVWAALDCPGGWAFDLPGRPMVLGRMTAVVHALPVVGQTCVCVGHAVRQEGRKSFSASTVRAADGTLLGAAEAVWIAVDPATAGVR